jgi:MerR family transcriptional regulator, light-induced transcriptional regulator
MHAFTIKDLENLSGIKAHTIRIWEQRYSFLSPNRTDTNIRFYTNEELKTLLNVALLNKYGYKISHIDKMSETDLTEKIRSLSSFEAQQERLLNDLINHKFTTR